MKNILEKNRFYVYAYLDPRKPGKYKYGKYEFNYEPFYIGKGNGNRKDDHIHTNRKTSNINPLKNNKIKKILSLNMNPIIAEIKRKLSEKTAFDTEKKMIKIIGRICDKSGPLTNLNDGGKGSSGHKMSKTSKLNISKNSAKYWKNKTPSKDSIEKGKLARARQDMSYRTRKYKVVSPEGISFVVDYGLESFCKKYGLLREKMVSVAYGKRKHHKGWTCKIIDRKTPLKDKTYGLTNLLTGEIVVTNKIRLFSKDNGLDSRRLYEVSRGERYCHKGWTCKIITPHKPS